MVHGCSVSWPTLKKLSLRWCGFPNDTISKLLSSSPNLECLTLYCCKGLRFLDLTKLFHLRTLEINSHVESSTTIVAPHIHCLRLINSQLPCALVDVSSLTEAKLDICIRSRDRIFKGGFLQAMVLGMLDKLQHVEKLTFGGNFLQILSLAEVRGYHFPMLEVKTLILETVIFQCVVPGIERLLHNSPDLKKLMVRARDCNTIPGSCLTKCLTTQGLNPEKCWRSKDGVILNKSRWNVESKHVTSFIEIMLKTQRN